MGHWNRKNKKRKKFWWNGEDSIDSWIVFLSVSSGTILDANKFHRNSPHSFAIFYRIAMCNETSRPRVVSLDIRQRVRNGVSRMALYPSQLVLRLLLYGMDDTYSTSFKPLCARQYSTVASPRSFIHFRSMVRRCVILTQSACIHFKMLLCGRNRNDDYNACSSSYSRKRLFRVIDSHSAPGPTIYRLMR